MFVWEVELSGLQHTSDNLITIPSTVLNRTGYPNSVGDGAMSRTIDYPRRPDPADKLQYCAPYLRSN